MSGTNKSWKVTGTTGFDSLKLSDEKMPELGDAEVLVKFKGASLNYRDLVITKGLFPFGSRENVVPGSDGAGIVEAVGSKVHRFKKGDEVIVTFNQGHLSGAIDDAALQTGVGGTIDGTLRQYGTYNEHGLVRKPSNISFVQAAGLSGAGVTAWNALYGAKRLLPGDWVLTQGTGGTSLFALQFAKAGGAKVIATTSSAAKADTLKALGADHVLNYREDANWGATAKALTGARGGVQHIIEVGGANSLQQSLQAIAYDGVVNIIGWLGGTDSKDWPSMLEALMKMCTVRGFLTGSRDLFEEMNRAIEANGLVPVVDARRWTLEDVPHAYQYMWDQKHFGKVGIEID